MKRTVVVFSILMLLVGLALFSCGGQKENIVARVGGENISLADFNIAHSQIGVFNRPQIVTYEDAEQFLNTLINKVVLVQEALKRGLDEDPMIAESQTSWEKELCIRTLFKEIADAGLEIPLAEIQDHYMNSRVQLQMRQIVVRTSEAAQDIKRQLDNGADFARLASSVSIDEQTAPVGGDMGLVALKQIDPILEKVAFDLGKSEISEPVVTGNGYHILQVEEIIEPSMDDFENHRHACANELRVRKRYANWTEFQDNIKTELNFQWDDETLLWLNDILPEPHDSKNTLWYDNLTDEEGARTLFTCSDGDWTVTTFMNRFGPPAGKYPTKSENGVTIVSFAESDIINAHLMDEAKRRGIHELDDVKRAIVRKTEERILDLLYADIVKDVTISENTIQEEYETHKEELVVAERAELALLVLENLESALEVEKELKKGTSFESLAEKHNKGGLKSNGGRFGLKTSEETPKDLRNYAFKRLKVGETSGVITTSNNNILIVRLLQKDPEHIMTWEEAKMGLRPVLLARAQDEAFMQFVSEKKDEIGVEIFPEVLSTVITEKEEAESPE